MQCCDGRRGRWKELTYVAGKVSTTGDDQRVVGHELNIVRLRLRVGVDRRSDGDRARVDRGPATHHATYRDPRGTGCGTRRVPEGGDNDRAGTACPGEHEETTKHRTQRQAVALTSTRRRGDEHEHEHATAEQCGADRHQTLGQRPERSPTRERTEDRHSGRRSSGDERGDRRGYDAGHENRHGVATRPHIRPRIVMNPTGEMPAQHEQDRNAEAEAQSTTDRTRQHTL